jgi:hypothetical protein
MSDILYRGNKLFEGSRMLLPEHVELIREHQKKQQEYQPPLLDDDQLEQMSRMIQEAYVTEKPLLVTYATKYEPRQFCGYVEKIDQYNRTIHLSFGSEKMMIDFDKLVSIDWP